MALKIYTGNHMENLVGALAGVVAEPLSSPFTPEVIVVQSKGMQRWLAMELAGRFGVWANCDYPFPNSMVRRLFRAVLPELPETSIFSADVMSWKIMDLLPGFLEMEEFAPLRRYLADDREGIKLFQLAGKIADTFDQYTLFRPKMLLEWEAGREGEWQAILWRELAGCEQGRHRARLREEYLCRLEAIVPGANGVPERISVFGISYLPSYHLDILAATAQVMDVNLFLLSPTREYWADIVSRRQWLSLPTEERALRVEGNPLLASLGRLGRDFSDMVIEMGDLAAVQEDLYSEPTGASLLATIQSGILNLYEAGEGRGQRFIAADRSVQVHSCHSPLREIEVLHDNLLALLEGGDGLEPRDIVVMTPAIEIYAPYISTVFEGFQDPARKIPYSIADRSLAHEGQVAAVFLQLLELPASRLPVTRVLDILESAPVSRNFGLAADELETIRGWLEETRVRWGMDERDRLRLGLPGYRDNTWQAGLDRLLLGYALPEEGNNLFHGILPYHDMEGESARALGKFAEFIAAIADLADSLNQPRTLGTWLVELRRLLGNFIAVDDDSARELATVVEALDELGGREGAAGFSGTVSLAVVHSWLAARLEREEKGLGFLTGGVTFCAMLPMRSIPFRVVALIGMNDGAFPRQSRPPGFDLIARNPRRGDRSLRYEDRYLFLESVLSARDSLYISYVGQSIRDNSEMQPSVLVSEFLDSIGRGFSVGDGVPVEERLITKHRLQAFSRDYFTTGSTLFSYSEENCAALREKNCGPRQPTEFLVNPVAPLAGEGEDIPLVTLLRFFDNPSRFFLENRLKIRLEDAAVPLEEREPFAIVGLEAYLLKQELLEMNLRGEDVALFLPIARCRGMLPPARHGEALFAAAVDEVGAFAQTVRAECGALNMLPPLDFQLELDSCRLHGRLDRIWPERMLRYRCAKLKVKDQLRAWLEHLVLNACGKEGYPTETRLLMTDGGRTFVPVADPLSILGDIIGLFREGMAKPLRFFPESAMAYAHKQEWNLERARRKWAEGYNNYPGEGNDPWFRCCFGQADPFTADFERIARLLLEPLLRHQE